MVRCAPLLALVIACSSSAGPSIVDAAADGALADGAPADAAPDQAPDLSPDTATAVTCATGTACNQRLDDGRCPGACVTVTGGLACRGQILHGLCFNQPPPEYPDSASAG